MFSFTASFKTAILSVYQSGYPTERYLKLIKGRLILEGSQISEIFLP